MLLSFAPMFMQDVEMNKIKPDKALQRASQYVPKEVPISRMLDSNIMNRPSASDVLEMPAGSGSDYFSRPDMELPFYWDAMATAQPQAIQVKDESTLAALWQAIEPTRPQEFGKGRDAGKDWQEAGILDETERRTQLVRAWSIQNPDVWRQYAAGMDKVGGMIAHGPPINSDELPVYNREKIAIRDTLHHAAEEGLRSDRGDAARRDINEVYLLHGLPKSVLHKVMHEGLNEKFAGGHAGALFGEGTYFAEDMEKADQYTGEPHRADDVERATRRVQALEAELNQLAQMPQKTKNEERHQQLETERGKRRAVQAAKEYRDAMRELRSKLYPDEGDTPDDVCYVLVCRVAMGYTIRTKGRRWDGRTKSWSKQCFPMDGVSTTRPINPANRDEELESPLLMREDDGTPSLPHTIMVPNACETDGVSKAAGFV